MTREEVLKEIKENIIIPEEDIEVLKDKDLGFFEGQEISHSTNFLVNKYATIEEYGDEYLETYAGWDEYVKDKVSELKDYTKNVVNQVKSTLKTYLCEGNNVKPEINVTLVVSKVIVEIGKKMDMNNIGAKSVVASVLLDIVDLSLNTFCSV